LWSTPDAAQPAWLDQLLRTEFVRHPKMIVPPHTTWLSKQARATLQLRNIKQVLACPKDETTYGQINRELAK
jgi:hypothetical protein